MLMYIILVAPDKLRYNTFRITILCPGVTTNPAPSLPPHALLSRIYLFTFDRYYIQMGFANFLSPGAKTIQGRLLERLALIRSDLNLWRQAATSNSRCFLINPLFTKVKALLIIDHSKGMLILFGIDPIKLCLGEKHYQPHPPPPPIGPETSHNTLPNNYQNEQF